MTQEKREAMVSELLKMKERMDSLYARSLECVDKQAQEDRPAEFAEAWQPWVDILENDRLWCALVDLPGVDEADLEVEMVGHELIIRGLKRTPERPEDTLEMTKAERPCGEFRRVLPLPAEIRQDRVAAELKQGVLTIRIDKQSGKSTGRKITIRST